MLQVTGQRDHNPNYIDFVKRRFFMGLLDKLIQMKTDHDAQKAQEAAENF